MDQRGYPVEPSEATTARALPESRLQAWSAMAARAQAIALVPSQVGGLAA
ncbi:hypothetical protein [Cellulomonas sp. URHE0023]|nr:hypothetical protein [Cellulomonas sp. URHE0023]